MPVDMFETRTMMDALREMKPPRTFLLDSFFPRVRTFATKAVDVDIKKGKRKLAPFVSPVLEGKVMTRDGFTTSTFEPAYVKPKRPTTAQHLLQRQPGEAVYTGTLSPQQRAARILGEDLATLTESITRREEWMAAQALLTGKVLVVGDGVDREVDFGMSATHLVTLAGTDLWTDQANSDPIKDLRTWRRTNSQDSGVTDDRCVFGSDVIDAFIDHPKVKDKLNLRRAELGQINVQQLPDGVTYWGYLSDPGLDIFTYDEWYIDDAGNEQPMVPVNKVIMGSTRAETRRAYGAIQDVDADLAGLYETQYFPKSWVTKDPSVRWLMVQSAPLPIPVQIDAFMAATVI